MPPLLVLHLRLLQAWIRLIRYAFAAPYAYATLTLPHTLRIRYLRLLQPLLPVVHEPRLPPRVHARHSLLHSSPQVSVFDLCTSKASIVVLVKHFFFNPAQLPLLLEG